MEKLKPCPFCGAELEYEKHIAIKVAGHPLLRLWAHPSGSCILAGLEVPQDDHEAWNRRIRCQDCKHNGLLRCPLVRIEKQEMIFLNHDPYWFCAEWEQKK